MEYRRFLPFTCLIFIILLTSIVYSPGLKGGFLFDDYYNLAEMNRYGDPHNWEAAKKFISQGGSGPTGRPIALASFLLHRDSWANEIGWLGDAKPFKQVNLLIHLICGLLLYWVTSLILSSYGYLEKKIIWISLLATSFWLLHPLFVSTTLYVIQRMAQLPLLFSLISIIGYLKGRELILDKPIKAYIIMTLSICLGTILATFSKENGALLPLLILVIEFCNPRKIGRPKWQWRAIFLWLPSLAILLLLIHYIDFSKNPWPNRSFNQVERLLSECRIVTDYLKWLFIPRIEGTGLLQDGFNISRGWLSPISTLYSALFLLSLLIISLTIRRQYPLISLGILFFFSAHLLESSVIGLELYFEHRNYMAAIFIFLPLAAGLVTLTEKIKPSLVIFISLLILSVLSLMTWQRSILWADSDKLQMYWAQNSPNSERGLVFMANYWADHGENKKASELLNDALQQHPKSGLIAFQLLLQKVNAKNATEQDFLDLQNSITQQRSDPQAIIRARDIVVSIVSDSEKKVYARPMLKVLDALMLPNSAYQDVPNLAAMILVLKGLLYIDLDDVVNGYSSYNKAIMLDPDVDKALAMVSDLGNHGYRQQAIQLLGNVEDIYHQEPDSKLSKSRALLDKEISSLRQAIQMDLEKSEAGK
ncbi:hypothetical protein [Acinetobacter modestus]|uniref:hypothetical protein n=1 Tax=Acinetobacter modestus TaxID=1776740 RepID=UPI001F4BB94B|nr:hypothetical protein [Acinetobacter modestus]MCH7332357.1 hypothetical protein [Acinetobacter modestus]